MTHITMNQDAISNKINVDINKFPDLWPCEGQDTRSCGSHAFPVSRKCSINISCVWEMYLYSSESHNVDLMSLASWNWYFLGEILILWIASNPYTVQSEIFICRVYKIVRCIITCNWLIYFPPLQQKEILMWSSSRWDCLSSYSSKSYQVLQK